MITKSLSRECLLFHSLSDPTRLRVLELLRDEGETSVSLIAETLGIGQSRLSFHLKALREARLVKAEQDGRWVDYSLDPMGFGVMLEYLKKFRQR
ncbi:MAG: metalloregulator ArsR/SmtB family transcription factor [Cyanobacteria bacterium J06642_11]